MESAESAEYVLEESWRKKRVGEENQDPGTFAPLHTRGGDFRYVYRNQNVIMAIKYSITIDTDILDNLSGIVDRPSLSGFWSKYVSLSISVSPLPCSRPIIRPPRFKRVGRCLFSIPECGKIFFEQLKFTLRKSFCGPPDLVDHKHRNRVPCFFTIRSLLTKDG